MHAVPTHVAVSEVHGVVVLQSMDGYEVRTMHDACSCTARPNAWVLI